MSSARRVAIVGLGVNNQPLVPFFLDQPEVDLIVADRKESSAVNQLLTRMGVPAGTVQVLSGPNYLTQLRQIPHLKEVYVTPGMPKDLPELLQLADDGVTLTSETDLFLERCRAPVIGITGSAGKTTTTTLVGEALKTDGRRRVYVGGNIGVSLLPDLAHIEPIDWVVMELSSFQLELVTHSPHGAAILNIAPNHLDVHRDFAAYQAAKRHIWDFQTPDDWALVPMDDPVVQGMFRGALATPVHFSLKEVPLWGAGLQDGWLVWRDRERTIKVVKAESLKIPGVHNIANALAATALVMQAGGDPKALQEVLSAFTGVPHRLEIVRDRDSIVYINDSIATAPDRTMAALRAIHRPIILIAGGYDKHLDYDALGKAIAETTVKCVVVLGQTAEKIARAVREHGQVPVVVRGGLFEAVTEAHTQAEAGDVVLLSPASASYDMFLNYEERGQRFREIVQQL